MGLLAGEALVLPERYRVLRELGRGGMGVVLLSHDAERDMHVAVKLQSGLQGDRGVLKREFRAAAMLRHPNLIELYDLVAHRGRTFITMEYIDGLPLRQWLAYQAQLHDGAPSRPPTALTHALGKPSELPTALPSAALGTYGHTHIREAQTAHVPTLDFKRPGDELCATSSADFLRVAHALTEIAQGLSYLHKHGIVHRDIKPSNIMLGRDGVARLLDFGISVATRQGFELGAEGRIIGTSPYLAPEYLGGGIISPAMDVYALGIMGFELCTGRVPFEGRPHEILTAYQRGPLPRVRELNPAVPAELDALIYDLMGSEPTERPTPAEIITRLQGGARPAPVGVEVPFVGRHAELATLTARVDAQTAGAQLLLIDGPSGIGKTAVAEKLLGGVGQRVLTWRGRCSERERIPYRAFDAMLEELATELIDHPVLDHGLAHPAALVRVFPSLTEPLAPYLPLTDEEARRDPRAEKERSHVALATLLGGYLGKQRGLLFIDDLQWADDDSLMLLGTLLERMRCAFTFVATCATQTGTIPARLAALPHLQRLTLGPLQAEETQAMLGALAPLHHNTPQLASLNELCAGMPLLAEFYGHALAANRRAGLEAAPLEVTPLELLTQRLRAHSANEHAVLEMLALHGRSLAFAQLRQLTELAPARLQTALRNLEHARVVRLVPGERNEAEYMFGHERLRAASEAHIAQARRPSLHRRLASWHEAHPGKGADEAQAYHWAQADEYPRAIEAGLRAAEAARGAFAFTHAITWFHHVLAWLAKLPDANVTLAATARAGLAEALELNGELAAASAIYRELARTHPSAARAYAVRAVEADLKRGAHVAALTTVDELLASTGERRATNQLVAALRGVGLLTATKLGVPQVLVGADDEHALRLHRIVASFLSTSHPLEAFESLSRMVALAVTRHDAVASGLGDGMFGAYLAAATLGRFGGAAASRAVQVADAANDPYSLMATSGCLGLVHMCLGQWPQMHATFARGEAVCERLGLARTWEGSFLRNYHALGQLFAGAPAQALTHLRDHDDPSDDLFARELRQNLLGRAYIHTGDLASARTLATAPKASPNDVGIAPVYRYLFLGELAIADGDWPTALDHAASIQRCLRTHLVSTFAFMQALAANLIVTARLGQARAGEPGAAGRLRRWAILLWGMGKGSMFEPTALRMWSEAEALMGHTGRATRLRQRAHRLALARGSRVERALLDDKPPPHDLRHATALANAIPFTQLR